MTVFADTGSIYALLDRDDGWHQRVRDWWDQNREPVRLPGVILPELTQVVGATLGPEAEAALVRAVAERDFDVEPFDPEADLLRVADLMQTYRDAPLGFVDAGIVAIAERKGVLDILTTDRMHFSVVRPRHVPAFRLLP